MGSRLFVIFGEFWSSLQSSELLYNLDDLLHFYYTRQNYYLGRCFIISSSCLVLCSKSTNDDGNYITFNVYWPTVYYVISIFNK